MSAEVTLQTQLMDSTTGEVLRSAAVSGAAAGAEGVPMSVVRERAALDAAAKVLPALGIELVQALAPAAAPGKGKSKTKAAKKPEPKKEPKKREPKKEEPKKSRENDDSAPKTARAGHERVARADTRPVESSTGGEVTAQAAAEPVKTPVQVTPPATPVADPVYGTPITASVKGTSNATGQPIPYGYALGEVKSVLPPRNRSGLKVPPWLGVAGFLAGISFLL